MKKLSAIIGLVLLVLTTQAALPQPDLIAQIHFDGAQKISADSRSNYFTNDFCSSEALALRAQTATKLSVWLAGWLQTNLNVTVPDGAAKLRPLFDDLQTSEWFLEARAAANGQPELAIAIKLGALRSQLWQDNLIPFFPAAAFKSTAGWLVFDSDPTLMGLGNRLLQKTSAPPAGWLDVDVNWPRLAQWYPILKDLALPETQITITAPDDNFRVNGKFYFPEDLALNLEPWCLPTNSIRPPLDSFTAVRGFASWYQSQTWAQPYQITPVPNQLVVWALQKGLPFQTFATMPVSKASSTFSEVWARLVPALAAANANNDFQAPITPVLTGDEIDFRGMPFVALSLRTLTEGAGQFLQLGMVPNTTRSTPLPPSLLSQLAAKNLVFYHLETTAQRMPQLLYLSQLGLVVTSHRQLDDGSAAFKWIQQTGSKMGTSDTEITQSGPAEMTFTRHAPSIFTAMELFMLANWLEAPNFPGCDLKMAQPSERLKRLREQHRPVAATLPPPAPSH